MKIGFVGLGQMGSAMARNLIAAGHEVTVWNRSGAKAAPLVGLGATQAATPAQAAGGAEIVATMLADDKAVEDVVFGAGGLLAEAKCHVSMSTISIALAERLTAAHAESGGSLVSAPVFGRPAAAEAAKLFIAAAGPSEALAACAPAFEAVGQRVFTIGETPSAANLVKLSGNFMIMAAIEAMAEAMTLAEKGGVARETLLEVLTGTLFGSPVYQIYGDILAADRFRPAGFAAPLGLKDMRLVGAAAEAARVPMPLLGVVRDHLLAAIAQEGDEIDWSAIALPIRRGAGLG
ncbi:NAD(P)-dependent oxidoreductase [Sphingosinicella sp. BN140058]|uniref:NAD(P)-dependent oxidoreductase n=1 Tax=Sphingosinicella sp. BN140058 TaxID=1892855 RepID=UPI0010139014|nr:NAD(P)-dependent oxidoreductase [Sphingosinicella sp. BN140058]QAY78379.1 NAD(P)-dependent oxidoreductase [Sphingosinicella sp. BN140058]